MTIGNRKENATVVVEFPKGTVLKAEGDYLLVQTSKHIATWYCIPPPIEASPITNLLKGEKIHKQFENLVLLGTGWRKLAAPVLVKQKYYIVKGAAHRIVFQDEEHVLVQYLRDSVYEWVLNIQEPVKKRSARFSISEDEKQRQFALEAK